MNKDPAIETPDDGGSETPALDVVPGPFASAALVPLYEAPSGWSELAPTLDLLKAAITVRNGRDVIALEPTAEGFDLYFADTQMGSARYSVTVSIPKK